MSTTDPAGVPPPDDEPRGVGVVAAAGDLGDLLLHGESLVTHAGRALQEAGVVVISPHEAWSSVVESGLPFVVHDAACPLTPAQLISVHIERARVQDRVAVGYRPVTDTIKTAVGNRVGSTVDRDALLVVTSPVIIPPSAVAMLEDWPDLTDVPAFVARLRSLTLVHFIEMPSVARRVEDESAVRVLEALSSLRC